MKAVLFLFRDIMVRLGEPLSKGELEDIIQDSKVDGDGRINYTGIVPLL